MWTDCLLDDIAIVCIFSLTCFPKHLVLWFFRKISLGLDSLVSLVKHLVLLGPGILFVLKMQSIDALGVILISFIGVWVSWTSQLCRKCLRFTILLSLWVLRWENLKIHKFWFWNMVILYGSLSARRNYHPLLKPLLCPLQCSRCLVDSENNACSSALLCYRPWEESLLISCSSFIVQRPKVGTTYLMKLIFCLRQLNKQATKSA